MVIADVKREKSRLLLLLLLSVAAVNDSPIAADDSEQPDEAVALEQVAEAGSATVEEPDEAQLETRRQIARIMVWLLGIVIFFGFASIAFVVIMGYRTRRLARIPNPPQSPLDPFWYLRPEKTIGDSDSATEEKPATDDPPPTNEDETSG